MPRSIRALAVAVVCAGVMAPVAPAVVIKTNWNELQTYGNGTRSVRLYVRQIEVRAGTWKAWVGVTNRSTQKIGLVAREERQLNGPYSYWAGPGLWWAARVPGGSWWPDASATITRSVKAEIRPAYVTSLAPKKSWFGTFSGTTARLPKDRLLRVGFGLIQIPGTSVDLQGNPLKHEVPLSTTHQFRLPKR